MCCVNSNTKLAKLSDRCCCLFLMKENAITDEMKKVQDKLKAISIEEIKGRLNNIKLEPLTDEEKKQVVPKLMERIRELMDKNN